MTAEVLGTLPPPEDWRLTGGFSAEAGDPEAVLFLSLDLCNATTGDTIVVEVDFDQFADLRGGEAERMISQLVMDGAMTWPSGRSGKLILKRQGRNEILLDDLSPPAE